jgi:hypothetical protein
MFPTTFRLATRRRQTITPLLDVYQTLEKGPRMAKMYYHGVLVQSASYFYLLSGAVSKTWKDQFTSTSTTVLSTNHKGTKRNIFSAACRKKRTKKYETAFEFPELLSFQLQHTTTEK